MKPITKQTRRPVINRADQKNRLPSGSWLKTFREIGVVLTERTDKPGTLHYSTLPGQSNYWLPILKHYKQDLLAELRGEQAHTTNTYERFMALPLVKCFECQNYRPGGERHGRYYPGRCEVRGGEVIHPARGIRCLWYSP